MSEKEKTKEDAPNDQFSDASLYHDERPLTEIMSNRAIRAEAILDDATAGRMDEPKPWRSEGPIQNMESIQSSIQSVAHPKMTGEKMKVTDAWGKDRHVYPDESPKAAEQSGKDWFREQKKKAPMDWANGPYRNTLLRRVQRERRGGMHEHRGVPKGCVVEVIELAGNASQITYYHKDGRFIFESGEGAFYLVDGCAREAVRNMGPRKFEDHYSELLHAINSAYEHTTDLEMEVEFTREKIEDGRRPDFKSPDSEKKLTAIFQQLIKEKGTRRLGREFLQLQSDNALLFKELREAKEAYMQKIGEVSRRINLERDNKEAELREKMRELKERAAALTEVNENYQTTTNKLLAAEKQDREMTESARRIAQTNNDRAKKWERCYINLRRKLRAFMKSCDHFLWMPSNVKKTVRQELEKVLEGGQEKKKPRDSRK